MSWDDTSFEGQTWPIWLIPSAFVEWYEGENWWRKELGQQLLPKVPNNIVQEVLEKNEARKN